MVPSTTLHIKKLAIVLNVRYERIDFRIFIYRPQRTVTTNSKFAISKPENDFID